MPDRYLLDPVTGDPVKCDDLLRWATEFERFNRRIAWDRIEKFTVSTVFLGLDHNFAGNGPPILFDLPNTSFLAAARNIADALAEQERLVEQLRELKAAVHRALENDDDMEDLENAEP